MKVLIIEDETSKSMLLQEYISEKFLSETEIVINEKQAKKRLIDKYSYDTILLDMSLPDMVYKNQINPYGGMNILSYMETKKIIIPVIVVTCYWDFKNLFMREEKELYFSRNQFYQEEIDYDNVEMIEDFDFLDGMHKYMSYTYNHVYFGAIEFSYHNEIWKKNLNNFLEDLRGYEYTGL